MTFLVTLCFGLFAFTCLLGMISFSEIAANRIRKDALYQHCALHSIVCCIWHSLQSGRLGTWEPVGISDLGNILIVYFNVPIVFVGAKCVSVLQDIIKRRWNTFLIPAWQEEMTAYIGMRE